MSHCLYAIVVRSEDVDPKHAKHFVPSKKEGFMVISPAFALKHKVPMEMRRVQFMTDYFGGFGEQEASYFDEDGKITHFPDSTIGGAINSALALLGVEREGSHDQFDVIGLGQYRQNEDLHPHEDRYDYEDAEEPLQHVSLPAKDYNEILGGLEDMANWISITEDTHRKIGNPEFTIGREECENMQKMAQRLLKLARKGVAI